MSTTSRTAISSTGSSSPVHRSRTDPNLSIGAQWAAFLPRCSSGRQHCALTVFGAARDRSLLCSGDRALGPQPKSMNAGKTSSQAHQVTLRVPLRGSEGSVAAANDAEAESTKVCAGPGRTEAAGAANMRHVSPTEPGDCMAVHHCTRCGAERYASKASASACGTAARCVRVCWDVVADPHGQAMARCT